MVSLYTRFGAIADLRLPKTFPDRESDRPYFAIDVAPRDVDDNDEGEPALDDGILKFYNKGASEMLSITLHDVGRIGPTVLGQLAELLPQLGRDAVVQIRGPLWTPPHPEGFCPALRAFFEALHCCVYLNFDERVLWRAESASDFVLFLPGFLGHLTASLTVKLSLPRARTVQLAFLGPDEPSPDASGAVLDLPRIGVFLQCMFLNTFRGAPLQGDSPKRAKRTNGPVLRAGPRDCLHRGPRLNAIPSPQEEEAFKIALVRVQAEAHERPDRVGPVLKATALKLVVLLLCYHRRDRTRSVEMIADLHLADAVACSEIGHALLPALLAGAPQNALLDTPLSRELAALF